jgi:hypothetical protein
MHRREIAQAGIGSLLLILGILLAALPKDWIEETVRIEPDAGSGTLELMIALGAIVVGLALIVPVAFRQVRARRGADSRAVGGGRWPDGP